MGISPDLWDTIWVLFQLTTVITLGVVLVVREAVRAANFHDSDRIVKEFNRILLPVWLLFAVIILYRLSTFLR